MFITKFTCRTDCNLNWLEVLQVKKKFKKQMCLTQSVTVWKLNETALLTLNHTLVVQGPQWKSGNTLASHLCGWGSIPVMAVSGKAGS